MDEEHQNNAIPMEKWDGECWKTFFETVCTEAAEDTDYSPWDMFAITMKALIGGLKTPHENN